MLGPELGVRLLRIHIDTVAYPKVEPSNPLATSVNCCAASRIRFIARELGINVST